MDIIIDTTNSCPMSCKYCGTRSNSQSVNELSKEAIKQILDASVSFKGNLARVFLGGGLFFCHSGWKHILEYNRSIKANIIIDSPMLPVTFSSIKLCPPREFHYNVSVSFWGIGQTHNQLSGIECFKLSNVFIDSLRQLQDRLYISFVITNELITQCDEVVNFINPLCQYK